MMESLLVDDLGADLDDLLFGVFLNHILNRVFVEILIDRSSIIVKRFFVGFQVNSTWSKAR
jgi:hypothetical protein